MLGGPWGTPGVVPGTVTAGSTYSQSYTLTLPSSMAFWGSSGQTALIDPSRIHLIAVVQKYNSSDINDREILNSFEIPLNLATGISNSLGNGSVTVFPNPANDNANIRIELTSSSNVLVEVYDLLGKRVAVLNDGMMNAGASTINWNGNTVESGIYMVKVTANGASSTTKVVINH